MRPLTLTQWPQNLKFLYALYLILNWQEWCFGGQVRRVVESWRCDIWPWPSDLRTWNSFMLCISFWIGRNYVLGDRCVAWWNRGDMTFDLGPVTLDPEIPCRSVSPKRMQIWEWDLQEWCIIGDKGALRGGIVATWPLTLAQWTLTPKWNLPNEWRFGNRGDSTVDLGPVTFDPEMELLDKWHNLYFPFLLVYLWIAQRLPIMCFRSLVPSGFWLNIATCIHSRYSMYHHQMALSTESIVIGGWADENVKHFLIG
jgi:hypothetical protein